MASVIVCNSAVSQSPPPKANSLPATPAQPVSLRVCTSSARTEHLVHPHSRPEGALNVSKGTANDEAFQRVAVEVFKARNLKAIQSLKKFLTALPSPSYIRRTLLQALYRLAEQDLETYRWVLQHWVHLSPELDLMEVAQQIATEQLQSQGLILNQNFEFASDGPLEMSESTKAGLLAAVSVSDRLLLEEILFKEQTL